MCDFSFNNAKKWNLVAKVDDKKLVCEQKSFYTVRAKHDLPIGSHTLSIKKKSLYDTPLCYLNILNPLFYLWQLKYFHRSKLAQHDGFSETIIHFYVRDTTTCHLELQFHNNDALSSSQALPPISCSSSPNIEKIKIASAVNDSKPLVRCKWTHVLSAILYALFFNFIAILNAVTTTNDILNTILFCSFITSFSISIIWRSLKTRKKNH